MAKVDIPQTISEITPAWLTKNLRGTGHLADGSVVGIDATVLGEGSGFMGDVVKLSLTYDSENDNENKSSEGPRSIIAKLPATVELNRKTGQLMGAYEREIIFYQTLGDTTGVRTPGHVYSEMEAASNSALTIRVIRWIDRLPRFLLMPVFGLLAWLASLLKLRYILLLEDMGHLRVGDQVAGCSIGDATSAVRAMAQLHAQYWCSEELQVNPWITPMDVCPNLFQRMYQRGLNSFREEYASILTPTALGQLEMLDAHGAEMQRLLAGPPFTLLHGDFRLDNMFFDDEAGEVVLLDWQGPLVGAAGFEVAYFLSAAISADVDGELEEQLLQTYHGELTDQGIVYSFERLRWEYQLGLLVLLHRLSMASDDRTPLEFGEGRGQDLVRTWVERVISKLARVDIEGLLQVPV